MGEIIAYTACFSSYFCLKKPSSPVPGTGTPQLSPFPFVLSELFTLGGWGVWGVFLLLPEPPAAEQDWGCAWSLEEPPHCVYSLVARKGCAGRQNLSLSPHPVIP